MKKELIEEIIHADLKTLYNLLEAYSLEDEYIRLVYQTVKNGLSIQYRTEYILNGWHNEMPDKNIVEIGSTIIELEDWYNELSARTLLARHALMQYIASQEEDVAIRR